MLTQWILNPDVKALCLGEAKMAEFDFHQPWMSKTALNKFPRFERSRNVGMSALTSDKGSSLQTSMFVLSF